MILWVITARSGSKGIPGKNIKNLGGHPLLAHRFLSLRQSVVGRDAEIVLSTDSEAYAAIGRQYGMAVPYLRPQHLATDEAASGAVLQDLMRYMESPGREYAYIGLLEPTSPFVRPETYDLATDYLMAEGASALVATRRANPAARYLQVRGKYLDVIAGRLASDGVRRRQEDVEITPAGGLYLSRWQDFKADGTFYRPDTLSYEVDYPEALEIDEPVDMELAEIYYQKGFGVR